MYRLGNATSITCIKCHVSADFNSSEQSRTKSVLKQGATVVAVCGWGGLWRRRTFQSCVAYVALLLGDMGLSHKLASYSVSGMKPSVVRRNSGCYTACVVLQFISLYTVSTKKVTPCIHCHNSDKQCQILTEFWTNNAMSNCKQITKFK